jgi:hypothetical protein
MNYADTILFAPLALGLLILVRNELVFRARQNAADVIHVANIQLIRLRNYGVAGFWPLYESFGSYSGMVFDLRRWTFNQFYPGLKQKVAA